MAEYSEDSYPPKSKQVRSIPDDQLKDQAMHEGLTDARGDEFIWENGEQFKKNPLHPVSSYGSQHFELVECDPGSHDVIHEARSMVRPFDCLEMGGQVGPMSHPQRQEGEAFPHQSPLYSGDSGKVGGGKRAGEGGELEGHSTPPRTIDRDEFRMSKNDKV
jgi:hypothetical protein